MFEFLHWSLIWKSCQLFGHLSEMLLVFYLGPVSAFASGSPLVHTDVLGLRSARSGSGPPASPADLPQPQFPHSGKGTDWIPRMCLES